MYYINNKASSNGNYGNPMGQPFIDCIEMPDEFLSAYLDANGFVNITVEDGVVTSVEKNVEAWEAWKATLLPEADPLVQAKSEKCAELSNLCESAINAGTSVKLPDGTEKDFSYSTTDQANVSEMFLACMMGAESYPYHANGEGCMSYTAAEITSIYGTLSMYKTIQITYQNQLKQYVNSLETVDDVNAVQYGQELSGDYLTTYNTLITEAQTQMQAVLAKVTGNETA